MQRPISGSPVKPGRDIHISDLPDTAVIGSSSENISFPDQEPESTGTLSVDNTSVGSKDTGTTGEKRDTETLLACSLTNDV